jgi:protein-tyrosine phosphatase
MGSLAQANSGSLSGIYGREAEQAVFRFLEMNLIHFIASDGHNTNAEDNPGAVLEDKEIPYLPEVVNPSKRERRLPLKISLFKRKN